MVDALGGKEKSSVTTFLVFPVHNDLEIPLFAFSQSQLGTSSATLPVRGRLSQLAHLIFPGNLEKLN